MYLVDLGPVWKKDPLEGLRATNIALSLLARTKALLADGRYLRSESLAMTSSGEHCAPFSDEAFCFSLLGAAVRARWELRERIADAEIDPSHVQQVMNAIQEVADSPPGGAASSTFECGILDGMIEALEDWREEQVLLLQMTKLESAA